MIRWDCQDGQLTIAMDVRDRCAVYLDNDSIIELSKGDADRRKRFVTAIRKRGSLLFSITNAIEIGGPKGDSADKVRAFLDALGQYWVPVELNPWKVVEKERAGQTEKAPISESFVIAYFQQRAYEQFPDGINLVDLCADSFFRLSAVMDWVQAPTVNKTVGNKVDKMYATLRKSLEDARAKYDRNKASLDRAPKMPFDSRRPATFALNHLLRTLIIEWRAYQFHRNDAMDFCHAVLASSAANIAALDKQWKRRVENLPEPNGLARIFYRPEIDQLVDLVEEAVDDLESRAAR